MDYWREHAEIAINDAEISGVLDWQLEVIAGVIESAHEYYGQRSGHDVASANYHAAREREQEAAIKAVEKEKDQAVERAQKMTADARRERDMAKLEAQEAKRKLAEAERWA